MDVVELLLSAGDAVRVPLLLGERDDDADAVELRLTLADVESSVSAYILPRRSTIDMNFIPI